MRFYLFSFRVIYRRSSRTNGRLELTGDTCITVTASQCFKATFLLQPIHLSSSTHPDPGHGVSRLSRNFQNPPSSSAFPVLPGVPQSRPPGQQSFTVPPAQPGSSPRPPPGGTWLEWLPREASKKHNSLAGMLTLGAQTLSKNL